MSLNEGVVPTPTIKGSFESKSPLWCHRQWDKIQTGQRTGCRELLFPGDTCPGPSHNSSSPHLDSTDALISVAPSQLTSAPPMAAASIPSALPSPPPFQGFHRRQVASTVTSCLGCVYLIATLRTPLLSQSQECYQTELNLAEATVLDSSQSPFSGMGPEFSEKRHQCPGAIWCHLC